MRLERSRPLIAVVASAMLVAAGCRAQAEAPPPAPLEVHTEGGDVRGVAEAGIRVFRGIPYAAPPVGPLRWRAPRPAAAWEGLRAAVAFGSSCPQPGLPEPTSEDCLTLNVWAPSETSPDRGWPVMVWIHGGGFRSGSGSDPVTHGDAFARDGVVLVTLDYRLGALGFLAHPALEAESGGEPGVDYGILDMVAALRWVRDNVAAFGGDPKRVTIFGESAGGMAVQLLMVCPSSAGLFQRAIAMSGYGTWPLPRTRTAPTAGVPAASPGAEDLGEALVVRAAAPGPPPATAEGLRTIPASRLAEATESLHLPIVDGTVVPEEPGIVFARGEQHDVPFVAGGDSYDGAVMAWAGLDASAFLASWGSRLDAVRRLYADDFAVSDAQGASRLFGEWRYGIAGRYLARQMSTVSSPAYLYWYAFVPEARRAGLPGAPHGSELGPLFGHTDDAEARQVGRVMRACWIRFAATGDPNGPGLPQWPRYDGTGDRWLVLDLHPAARERLLKERLDFLEERYLERVHGADAKALRPAS
jgi:para-nitrobenzyl esterase